MVWRTDHRHNLEDPSMHRAFGITQSRSRYVLKDRVTGGLAALVWLCAEMSGQGVDVAAKQVLHWLEDTHAPAPFDALLAAIRGGAALSDGLTSTILPLLKHAHDAEYLSTALRVYARLAGQWASKEWLDRSEYALTNVRSDQLEPGPVGKRDEPFQTAWARITTTGNHSDLPVEAVLLGLEHGFFGLPPALRARLEASGAFVAARTDLASIYAERSHWSGAIARTSSTHPLRIGTLALGPDLGRIGVTFCPGKHQSASMTGAWQRDLGQDLDVIRAWGAGHLVTLVEQRELSELHVPNLPDEAAKRGIRWHHFPIIDGTIPDTSTDDQWLTLADVLLTALREGRSVVVHCKGGLGRAGTMAARLLLQSGASLSAEDAVARVRSVRENAIETAIQERFLLRLAVENDRAL
jgi:ADP-ribosyl-[dinitrogen reductase] hydrolase